MQQYLVGMLPALRYVLPWNLAIPIGLWQIHREEF
jgi:hypothetical protein